MIQRGTTDPRRISVAVARRLALEEYEMRGARMMVQCASACGGVVREKEKHAISGCHARVFVHDTPRVVPPAWLSLSPSLSPLHPLCLFFSLFLGTDFIVPGALITSKCFRRLYQIAAPRDGDRSPPRRRERTGNGRFE